MEAGGAGIAEVCAVRNALIPWKRPFAVGVAQLGRAPDCGSGGRGFESHHPPQVPSDLPMPMRKASWPVRVNLVLLDMWAGPRPKAGPSDPRLPGLCPRLNPS